MKNQQTFKKSKKVKQPVTESTVHKLSKCQPRAKSHQSPYGKLTKTNRKKILGKKEKAYHGLSAAFVANFLVEMIFEVVQPDLGNSDVVLACVGTGGEVVYQPMSEHVADVRARHYLN